MKYDLETYQQQNPLKILPGMPSGPDVIDTTGMRAVLPALIIRIFAMLRPEGIERGALSRLLEVRRMFLSVYQAEVYNIKLWCLKSMKADRNWQRQVREDLGGEAALLRWDKRYAKMMANDKPEGRAARKAVLETARRKKSKVKTDRFNVFRLAPVSQATDRKMVDRPSQLRCSYRPVAVRLPCIKPIPLTPDDLREPARSTPTVFDTPGQKAAEVDSAINNAPILSLEDILNALNRLRRRYEDFHLNITYLDVEISFPQNRQSLIPI